MRIHIFGAAGSGTSTLGEALSKKYGYKFIDVDNFYWLDTFVPFTKAREKNLRVKMLKEEIEKYENCIICGAVCVWGDELIPYFDLVIKLETPTPLRIKRLRERELKRFGERIQEGGDMYYNHLRFIEWAKVYDDGDVDVRSNKLHNHWLKKINSKVLILDGSKEIEELINLINI